MSYKPTIGLEIHAELKTASKMFCSCKNDQNETRPNVNVCPVCMGHPGTLPVINKQAVKNVIKMGLAVGGKIADFTEWDRKNYFYPDIPKGYQITQYKYPLVSGGQIDGIEITRIHLEEDTAKSTHDTGGRSLVDFNRSGLPLMELVTEPVIHNGKDAVLFAKDLQRLLRYLEAGDANMEKGQMRVEANISVSKTDTFGTKTEVKNLNSFKSVEKAIDYEIKRQIKLLDSGEKVIQETRGWDDAKGETYLQRVKESSHDYRYFPDPDLPKMMISEIPEFSADNLSKEIPELPWAKRERLMKDFDLKEVDADLFLDFSEFFVYFEQICYELGNDKKLSKIALNYLITDYLSLLKKSNTNSADIAENINKISVTNFAKLVKMISGAVVSSRGAKDTLKIMFEKGGEDSDPEVIAKENGFIQTHDEGEIEKTVAKIISENEKVVAEYKSGKESVLQFLIGQGMKATKGSANPEILMKIFKKLL
ncbi:MAG: Asp-tRNA(Asn)/Glu-tRNA(Gln) amidotransferase subunit GatB [bacterium]|nr:Asp-tRNA(Asn)/Glu-tRNA(Gln) amidotransferase subunit GatB [bacterium]